MITKVKVQYLFFIFFCLLRFSNTLAQPVTPWLGPNRAADPYRYSSVKSAVYTNATVGCAHPLAALVGAEIMKAGGNAFDAAIAVQYALAVVYPGAGNIGGGGFLVGRTAAGKTIALDYRETAPAAASRNMYLDEQGNPQAKQSLYGAKSGGVPGSVAGMFATQPYAKFTAKTLIQPAIDLAEFGYAITKQEADRLNDAREDFIKYSSGATAFVKEGKWKAGDTLVQKELAATLRHIRDKGQKGFYEGPVAAFIVREMSKGSNAKGIISEADLKNYKVRKREALSWEWNGNTIIGMPPPSSGGIIVLQLLNMANKDRLARYGFQTANSVHLMAEAERRAFADRSLHMGDPDFYKVPLKTLRNPAYLHKRMLSFDSSKTTPSTGVLPGNVKESEETTHISIADKAGNVVSITTTLNNSYGSRCVVSGAGFILNDEMDDFSLKPGVPNFYGAVGGEANAIAPGKRMLSSMSPTLVINKGKASAVCGSPGGTTIPTSVFQVLENMFTFGMSATEAVAAPRFHHQWLPDELFVEPDFKQSTRNELKAFGWKITERSSIGRTEVIKFMPDGRMESAADIRGDDSVAGF
ncbi:MAG: gamma-glutamyltransferase [Bacteroidota bacterium]